MTSAVRIVRRDDRNLVPPSRRANNHWRAKPADYVLPIRNWIGTAAKRDVTDYASDHSWVLMTTLSTSRRSARRYFILIIGFALVASAEVMRSHLDSVDPPSSRAKLSSMQLSRSVLRVGDVMPANALTLRRLGGDDIDLQQASPGRTVIAFWASWCGPCIRDLQLLRDQKALLDSHGVGVVAIAIDREGNIRSIVDSERLGFAVLLADMNGVQPLSVFGQDRIVLPYTVLLDSQHRILFADSGSIDKERLTRLLLTNFAATK